MPPLKPRGRRSADAFNSAYLSIKVGPGQSQSSDSRADILQQTNKDSYLTTLLKREYHEDAVERLSALKSSSASGTIAMPLPLFRSRLKTILFDHGLVLLGRGRL